MRERYKGWVERDEWAKLLCWALSLFKSFFRFEPTRCSSQTSCVTAHQSSEAPSGRKLNSELATPLTFWGMLKKGCYYCSMRRLLVSDWRMARITLESMYHLHLALRRRTPARPARKSIESCSIVQLLAGKNLMRARWEGRPLKERKAVQISNWTMTGTTGGWVLMAAVDNRPVLSFFDLLHSSRWRNGGTSHLPELKFLDSGESTNNWSIVNLSNFTATVKLQLADHL